MGCSEFIGSLREYLSERRMAGRKEILAVLSRVHVKDEYDYVLHSMHLLPLRETESEGSKVLVSAVGTNDSFSCYLAMAWCDNNGDIFYDSFAAQMLVYAKLYQQRQALLESGFKPCFLSCQYEEIKFTNDFHVEIYDDKRRGLLIPFKGALAELIKSGWETDRFLVIGERGLQDITSAALGDG